MHFAVNPFLLQPDKFDAIEEEEDEAEKNAEPPAADPIDSMCQQLSQELSLTAANVAVAVASPPSDSTVNNNSSPQVSEQKKLYVIPDPDLDSIKADS